MAHNAQETKNAPYYCNACNKTFATYAELKEHNRLLHPTRTGRFMCSACGEIFNTGPELKAHGQTVHARGESVPSE